MFRRPMPDHLSELIKELLNLRDGIFGYQFTLPLPRGHLKVTEDTVAYFIDTEKICEFAIPDWLIKGLVERTQPVKDLQAQVVAAIEQEKADANNDG